MQKSIIALSLSVFLAGCASMHPTALDSAADDGWHLYGASKVMHGTDVSLADAADVRLGTRHDIVVEGTITEVCAKKGCWMRLREGDDELFVRFHDYAFFVPRNAAGHRAVIQGHAMRQVMSVDEQRHYAEDAGMSQAEINAITEPKDAMMFFAHAVRIEGDGLDAPHTQASNTPDHGEDHH